MSLVTPSEKDIKDWVKRNRAGFGLVEKTMKGSLGSGVIQLAQESENFTGDLAGINDIQSDPFTELEKKIALRAEVAALKFQSELEKGEIPDENLAGLKDIRF